MKRKMMNEVTMTKQTMTEKNTKEKTMNKQIENKQSNNPTAMPTINWQEQNSQDEANKYDNPIPSRLRMMSVLMPLLIA